MVEFSSTGYRLFLDLNQNFVMDTTDRLVKQVNWSEFKDVSMNSCNLPSSMIAFTPDGRTMNNTGGLGMGTITLKSDDAGAGSLDIVISSAGNVKVE